jgi:hypothetical protein
LASPEAQSILNEEWLQVFNILGPEPISKSAFLEELAMSLLSNKKTRDWDSYAPRMERVQWIIGDLQSLKVDPKATISKPPRFPGTEASWKHQLKKYELGDITFPDGTTGTVLHLTCPKLQKERAAAKKKFEGTPLGDQYQIRPLVTEAEFWYRVFCDAHVVEGEPDRHYGRDDTFNRITARHVLTMKKDFVSSLIARCPHPSCREHKSARQWQMDVMASNGNKRSRSAVEGEAAPVEAKRQRRLN